MRLVFVSDSFHHHQKGVANALFRLTNGSYCFITTKPIREERKIMGFVNDYPEYVFDASSRTPDVWGRTQQIIDDADVVVLGSAPYSLLKNRMNNGKLTFRYSERLLKQFKHYLKIPFYMIDNYRTKGCYMLCASAFAKYDYNSLGAFKEKCYKWGYFTEVSMDGFKNRNVKTSYIKMMWCSRFLSWKHPELPLFLAQRLKKKGYTFSIYMYGSGILLDRTRKLAEDLEVADVILFCGNVSNHQIQEGMRKSDIFLFTSDRGEGWGAVSNESMSNGCVLVASDKIGSVPYLVKNRENGCVFRSSSRLSGFSRFGVNVDKHALDSLEEYVEWLINNPDERRRLSINAFETMRETWSPETAAKNLLILIENIKQGRDTSILYGPCSKA